MNNKAIIQVDDKGRVELPMWVWKTLLKLSGSKAKTLNGQRRAVKKEFQKALLLLQKRKYVNLSK
jgi:hypothetical protein